MIERTFLLLVKYDPARFEIGKESIILKGISSVRSTLITDTRQMTLEELIFIKSFSKSILTHLYI
jgi:hypothetical protein